MGYDEFNLIIKDVQREYRQCRTSGKNRYCAIEYIKKKYARELQDEDDRVAVMIGLSLALCKKRELVEDIVKETLLLIQFLRDTDLADIRVAEYLTKVEQKLQDEKMLGNEAPYHRQNSYKPDWQIGDLFAHTIQHPSSEKLGIKGWSILFYKIGEHIDKNGRCRQLMYVTLCMPGKEPKTNQELEQLGFLRMMPQGRKWDYMVQIIPKSKKDELHYELTKIGTFLHVSAPMDCTTENPLVAMPMFGRLRKNDIYPDFEEHVCLLYKQHGNLPK